MSAGSRNAPWVSSRLPLLLVLAALGAAALLVLLLVRVRDSDDGQRSPDEAVPSAPPSSEAAAPSNEGSVEFPSEGSVEFPARLGCSSPIVSLTDYAIGVSERGDQQTVVVCSAGEEILAFPTEADPAVIADPAGNQASVIGLASDGVWRVIGLGLGGPTPTIRFDTELQSGTHFLDCESSLTLHELLPPTSETLGELSFQSTRVAPFTESIDSYEIPAQSPAVQQLTQIRCSEIPLPPLNVALPALTVIGTTLGLVDIEREAHTGAPSASIIGKSDGTEYLASLTVRTAPGEPHPNLFNFECEFGRLSIRPEPSPSMMSALAGLDCHICG